MYPSNGDPAEGERNERMFANDGMKKGSETETIDCVGRDGICEKSAIGNPLEDIDDNDMQV